MPKRALKASKTIDFEGQESDFMVLKNEGIKRHCYIIELKDEDMFDTKKATKEKNNLKKFESYIATKLQYTTSIHIYCFNNEDKASIIAGLKNRIIENEAMTGKEFCDLLDISYEYIITKRQEDAIDNLDYFVGELLINICH